MIYSFLRELGIVRVETHGSGHAAASGERPAAAFGSTHDSEQGR